MMHLKPTHFCPVYRVCCRKHVYGTNNVDIPPLEAFETASQEKYVLHPNLRSQTSLSQKKKEKDVNKYRFRPAEK